MSFHRLARAAVLGLAVAAAAPAFADEITDAIEEARKAYGANDLGAAKAALDVASQLIAQRSAAGLARYLPQALAGWRAEEPEVDASSAAAIFGGGVIAKRQYNSGDKDVTVQILANSPLLNRMAPMFGNAQMLGAMGKVFRVKGKTAVFTSEGQIQLVVGRAFVTIEGSGTEADKRAFLDALDLAAIEKFGG
jgi:hypothetical protein